MSPGVLPCDILGYFLGNVLGTCLYGALTVQLYRYYISFPKDRKPFKVVIYTVYITETILTVLLIYDLGASIHNYSVDLGTSAFRRVACPSAFFQTTQILAVCGGIVTFLTQSMFAYRIRIVMKLKYTPWVIILVMAAQLFAVIIASIISKTETLFCVTVVWTSMSMVVDLTITSIMVWFLRKDEIYCKQLKKKIARLVYLILGTGLLTTATNICIFVLAILAYGYSYGLLIILSKLYANSMMVLANSRIPSARSEADNHAMALEITTIQSHARSQASGTNAERRRRAISVDPEAHCIRLSG